MKPRSIQTIVVTWTRLGRKLQREFNSRRRADEFCEELVKVARHSATFGSKITIDAKVEIIVDAK